MTVNELINGITSGFEGDFIPTMTYLTDEYNRIIRILSLMLPTPDAETIATVNDGKLECEVLPEQVRRVFCGEYELLKASRALTALMPEAKLYHAAKDGIYVTVKDDCTLYYRSVPKEVKVTSLEVDFPFDERYVPLVRAWLNRSIYLYIGDFDSANAHGEEYNALLENFKRENGVAE